VFAKGELEQDWPLLEILRKQDVGRRAHVKGAKKKSCALYMPVGKKVQLITIKSRASGGEARGKTEGVLKPTGELGGMGKIRKN